MLHELPQYPRHPDRLIGLVSGTGALVILAGAVANGLWWIVATQLLLLSNAVRWFLRTGDEGEPLGDLVAWRLRVAVAVLTVGALLAGFSMGSKLKEQPAAMADTAPIVAVGVGLVCLLGTTAYYALLPRLRR